MEYHGHNSVQLILPLLVFFTAEVKTNKEKKHTALVVSFDRRGNHKYLAK